MIDESTDFFKIVDNFKNNNNIPSIPIIKSKIDYIPKVTIAIPTYKRANLLKEAIDSALCQMNFEEYEVLVVDNNPDRGDETEQLLLSYNNSKLSYYKNQQNLGMTGNWNRLYCLAQGRWVAMLHDDDLLLPTYLQEMYSVIISDTNIDLLACFSKSLKNDAFESHLYYKKCIKRKINYSELFAGNIFSAPVGLMIKRDKIFEYGGFNEEYYPTSDYCLCAIISRFCNAYLVYKELTVYRILINESMKDDVLSGFIHNDFYLSNNILRLCNIPFFFRNRIQYFRLNIQIKALQTDWNKDFSFDAHQLLDSKYNMYISKYCYKIAAKILKKMHFIF